MKRNYTLSAEQSRAAVERARAWEPFEEVARAAANYASHAWSGRQLPALHLEDVSHIPFVADIDGVEQYQHRARVRAHSGDIFAAVTPISEGYEAYCQSYLHLEDPAMVLAEPVAGLMAVTQACGEGTAFEAIKTWAQAYDEVMIHPYMSISDVWVVADKLQRDSGTHVEVVGPNPEPLWVANGKGALSELIRLVLGDSWLVETTAAHSVSELAKALRAYAGRHASVGLKRTRCASAMGNAVYKSATVNRETMSETQATIASFLESTQWKGDEDVLVVEWVETDLSPSTQIWIPPMGGLPILEGVYEQLLEGEEKCFLGSRPSVLPEAVNLAIGEASLQIASVLQALGYTGRCSFDFIVDGDLEGDFHARFTECNGRWGGTSTPMYLTDRLMETRPHYIAQDYQRVSLEGAQFVDLVGALNPHLFRKETGQGRFILYNVGPLSKCGKFDVISLGRTPEEAIEGVEDIIPSALGI